MPEHMASIVDWYGPYEGGNNAEIVAGARKAARNHFDDGLYVAIGHAPGVARGRTTLQYIGIGAPLASRLYDSHHALGTITLTSLWLGEIATAGIPGRRTKRTNPHLDIVEWAHAYFLKIPINERKTVNPPDCSLVVLNRWWGVDYENTGERPAARWADVLEFSPYSGIANICWFGARPKIVSKRIP